MPNYTINIINFNITIITGTIILEFKANANCPAEKKRKKKSGIPLILNECKVAALCQP